MIPDHTLFDSADSETSKQPFRFDMPLFAAF